MKHFLLISLIISSLTGFSQKLEISTFNNKTTYYLGESINVNIELFDINDSLIVLPAKSSWILPSSSFENSISVKPLKQGKFTIGPYSIKLGNQFITSNKIEVHIIKLERYKSTPSDKIEIIAPKKVQVNEEFDIILKSQKKLYEPKPIDENSQSFFKSYKSLQLKNEFLEHIKTTYNSKIEINNNIENKTYTYTIKVKAIKKGVFEIQKEDFNYEINLDFPQHEIEVL